MAIKLAGKTGITLVTIERAFDAISGWQTTITFEGLQDAIMAAAAAGGAARIRVTQKQGPWYQLQATYANLNDGSAEVPVDQYELVSEYPQRDLRSNRLLHAAVAADGGDGETLSRWLKAIRDNLDDPDANPFVEEAASEGDLRDAMQGGVTGWSQKVPVLRKIRTYSLDYATAFKYSIIETVYTTATLTATFGIPGSIAGQLPANPPTTPTGFAWAWIERAGQRRIIPAYNRVEETREWEFGACSTLLYIVT